MDIQELIQGCKKGHRPAQKQLYDAFAGQMLGVCYRYTKQLEDAEDVLQEGFIKVFKNIGEFRNVGSFGGWLRKIMVNTALNYLNKHARYSRHMNFEDVNDAMFALHGDEADVGTYQDMAAKELANMIRKLPVGYQTVFNLYAIDGYSHAEIATLLNIKEATARSQYFKAKRQLAIWITNGDDATNKSNRYAG